MKKIFNVILAVAVCECAGATQRKSMDIARAEGDTLHVIPLADNAVRVKIGKYLPIELEEFMYLPDSADVQWAVATDASATSIALKGMPIEYDHAADALRFQSLSTGQWLEEVPGGRYLRASDADGMPVAEAGQRFLSPDGEKLFGTGQFQDGNLDVRALTRRLTQVNTQIALPVILSNRGYAIVWNNYGLTHFNPARESVMLALVEGKGSKIVVDVTSTEGNKREERNINQFVGEISVTEDGVYSILLDVGQTMARKHNLSIDGECMVDINNLWLPPTTSFKMFLTAGKHAVTVEGEKNDHPVVYWRRDCGETEFLSPFADGIDYTVITGTPDEIIATLRSLTGEVPMLPQWALGYVHCRERYNTQDELLQNAREFRRRGIPIDVIVQDWQWWGKYGWNAMKFDEDKYPDPKAMTDELHDMDMRLMISVWAKIDKNSELGKATQQKGYYIPGTDWIDFFNPDAADFYRENQSERLIKPYGIDAWWQDATEPENDDLHKRRIAASSLPGDIYRNVYSLAVNKAVYHGLREDDLNHRGLIMTRSAFPGIQRYGVFTWSGDVGHDFATLRRQIVGGLGQMATGVPWWTFDAGGFFRPGDQYDNDDYKETMLRWVQTSAFLPMMRTHGYMSQTEPWRYGSETEEHFVKAIELRYAFLPYNYTNAVRVSREGYTMMRPLVMDFWSDPMALEQKYQYMWGPSVLVAPVLESMAATWDVYLPQGTDWIDFWTGKRYQGGATATVDVDLGRIPLMVRSGSIIPMSQGKKYASDLADAPLDIRVYPGADGTFTLYEDAGEGLGYKQGEFSEIPFAWSEANGTLAIGDRKGSYPGMPLKRTFRIVLPGAKPITVKYEGAQICVSL